MGRAVGKRLARRASSMRVTAPGTPAAIPMSAGMVGSQLHQDGTHATNEHGGRADGDGAGRAARCHAGSRSPTSWTHRMAGAAKCLVPECDSMPLRQWGIRLQQPPDRSTANAAAPSAMMQSASSQVRGPRRLMRTRSPRCIAAGQRHPHPPLGRACPPGQPPGRNSRIGSLQVEAFRSWP